MKKVNYIEKTKKRNFIKIIFAIIIGVLITQTSVYYAATIYFQGNDVSYTGSNLAAETVQEAIDELYDINSTITPLKTITSTRSIYTPSADIYSTKKFGWVFVSGYHSLDGGDGNKDDSDVLTYAPPDANYGVYFNVNGSNGQNTAGIRLTAGGFFWENSSSELLQYSADSQNTYTAYFSGMYPAP